MEEEEEEEEKCKEGRRFLHTGLPWAQRRLCIRYLEAYFFFRIIVIVFKARGGYASGTLRLRYLFLFLFTSTIGTLRL